MRIKNKNASIAFKLLIFLIGLFSILANIGIFGGTKNFKLLTMFTTLSNILVVVYFFFDIIHLISVRHDKEEINWNPTLKGIAMMSITTTLLIAQFVLHMGVSFENVQSSSFLGLHYLVPILTILDWLLFDKKGQIKITSPLVWLLSPYAYFIAAMLAARNGTGLGASETSLYPYPFLDIDALGVGRVISIVLVLTIAFVIVGYIFYGIDDLLCKKDK